MVSDRLETDRLLLRKFIRRDADALTEAVQSSLSELGEWLPWVHAAYGKDDAVAFIRDSHQAWKDGRAFDFAIRRRTDPVRHVGNISIWHVSRLGRVGEIGYWVRSDATADGIATEATARMVELGFSELGFHKITLRIAVGNRGSERVAEKLGFVREGILREELRINDTWVDHGLFSLLESEFRRTRREMRPVAD